MSDIAALEAQLRANPSDWDAWLVYADYLTDQGDARGTLVRLEHKLETERLTLRQQQGLKRQIDELVRAHQPGWLQGWQAPRGTQLIWYRGFVQVVLFENVAPGDLIGAWEALAAHRAARFLTGLHVRGELAPVVVSWLFQSEALRGLSTLYLDKNELGPHGATALARSTTLGPLTELGITQNGIGDDGAEALAGVEALRGLTLLDLTDNGIGPKGTLALARSPRTPGALTRLMLGLNPIGPAGARALVGTEGGGGLSFLDLQGCNLGDEGAAVLAGATALRSLVELGLAGNGIGDDGAVALARSWHLARLQGLTMGGNTYGYRGANELRWSLRRCKIRP